MKKNIHLLIIFLIIILLFIKIILPYFQTSVYYFDTIGHFFSAKFVKEELFPKVVGLNTDFYFGYAHNQFYPPLFSYIVALLSFLIPIKIAFKLVIALSILFLPLGFYSWARSLKLNKNQSLFFVFLVIGFLTLPSKFFASYSTGINFDSLIAGLIPNFLGLLLLLFYMASLPYLKNKKYFIISTLLLTAIVLTHFFIATVAIIYSISFFITAIIERKKLIYYVKHYIFVFLLSAFWIIPFLLKQNFSQPAFIPFKINLVFLLTSLVFCLILIYFHFKKEKYYIQLAIFILLLLMLISIVHYFFLPLHTYRIAPFIYITTLLLISKILKINKLLLLLGAILMLILLFVFTSYPYYPNYEDSPIYLNNEGRIFVLSRNITYFPKHTLEYLIPYWNKQPGVMDVFIESSLHGDELTTLKTLLVKDAFRWGAAWNPISLNLSQKEKIRLSSFYLNLFGINTLISDLEDLPVYYEEKEQIATIDNKNLYAYYLMKSPLIEPLKSSPISKKLSQKKWNKFIYDRFLNETTLYVNTADNFTIDKSAVVELKELNRTKIKFKIHSKKETPILIKYSYLPNWHAYSEGKKIPIYQISPHLMMIYAKGDIILTYKYIWKDYLGIVLSICGLILLFFFIFRQEKQRFK